MCKCGCNSCETKSTALVLKESKFVHTPISEGLKYHIDNQIPLNENIYRIGSKEYMKLYTEARSLYSRGKLDVSEDDKYFLTETHVGSFGIFEQTSKVSKKRAKAELKQKIKGVRSDGMGKYDGKIFGLDDNDKKIELKDLKDLDKFNKFELGENKRVPLDIPMLNEEQEYYVTYNKGRGQGKGLVKSKESDYEEPRIFSKEEAEKYVKMASSGGATPGGSTAYWVSDRDMNRINENIDTGDFLNKNRDQIELDFGPRTFRMLQIQLMKDDEAFVRDWLVTNGYMDEEKLPFEESKYNQNQYDQDQYTLTEEQIEEVIGAIKSAYKKAKKWGKKQIKKAVKKVIKSVSPILEDEINEKKKKSKLCKRGRDYIAARKRAGEKSSAYLSGRAVKVCKGSIKGAGGKKKKSYKNENVIPNHDGKAAPYGSGYKKLDIDKIAESLKDWFGKEDWVRINTSGNITGKCGTMKKGKATTRCLPRKKAQAMTKAARKATVAKKVRGSKKGKQFVAVKEAEFRGKEVSLNKPKRGGSKAYYVYVRDPKTKKIKKVSFGSGGLRAKIKNKDARNAFAKRHNCKNKKDRTTAGYWSCNLPRYAKQLGLGANMNTFW